MKFKNDIENKRKAKTHHEHIAFTPMHFQSVKKCLLVEYVIFITIGNVSIVSFSLTFHVLHADNE